MAALTSFFKKYYDDTAPRSFVFGINPGRFGAGITGVPFTDPIRLAKEAGITNDFPQKPELSAQYVWQCIHEYGGPQAFCRDFYITSLVPLGFLRDGVNVNYYDDKHLAKAVAPYVVWNIETQLTLLQAPRRAAICLGEGQNYRYFQRLNDQHGFFERIIPLPHPRWVMQYRRRFVQDYVAQYIAVLAEVNSANTATSD